MRQQHDVDLLGIDAGGGEILQGAADRALGRLEIGDAVAGVDQDQLAAGVDQLRVERHRHHALAAYRRLPRRQRLVLRTLRHEIVGHRKRTRTVVDRGAFVSADLVAIEAGRLGAGRRLGRRGRRSQRCQRGRGASNGGAGQKITAVQVSHGVFPLSRVSRFTERVFGRECLLLPWERKRGSIGRRLILGWHKGLEIKQGLGNKIHSTTSSARSRIEVGRLSPSALAVLRLMTISNLVGRSTGTSAGRMPCRTLPSMVPVC